MYFQKQDPYQAERIVCHFGTSQNHWDKGGILTPRSPGGLRVGLWDFHFGGVDIDNGETDSHDERSGNQAQKPKSL